MHNPTDAPPSRQDTRHLEIARHTLLRIEAADEDLAYYAEKIEELKKEREVDIEGFCDELRELHKLASASPHPDITPEAEELETALKEAFWQSVRMSRVVRKLAKELFGADFDFGDRIYEAECKTCGTAICFSVRCLEAVARGPDECRVCSERVARTRRLAKKAEDERRRNEAVEADKARAAEESRIAALRAMPYADYLQTDHWKELRKYALRRTRFRCGLCNSQTSLDVHHRTYERRGCERLDDLIALCRPCHEKFHGLEKGGTSDA